LSERRLARDADEGGAWLDQRRDRIDVRQPGEIRLRHGRSRFERVRADRGKRRVDRLGERARSGAAVAEGRLHPHAAQARDGGAGVSCRHDAEPLMLDITPVLKVLATRRRAQLARMDARVAQERSLLKLVARAAETRFGKDHGFASIKSVADFQARVPLRTWDAMWSDYFKASFPDYANVSWPERTPYLALASGTTGARTKHVPVTEAMNRSNSRAGFDLLAYHFAAKPHSRLFDGKTFILGGSTK